MYPIKLRQVMMDLFKKDHFECSTTTLTFWSKLWILTALYQSIW